MDQANQTDAIIMWLDQIEAEPLSNKGCYEVMVLVAARLRSLMSQIKEQGLTR
jgi:hypothetical protein